MFFKKKDRLKQNRYDVFGKELEQMGLLKPIYKSKIVTICNVCDYCYYIIYNESGMAINIRPDAIIKNIEEDPMVLLALFSKLPYEEQIKSSFLLSDYRIKKVLLSVKEKIQKDPKLSQTDLELEHQIIEKYGAPNIN